jgi:ATP-dependent HslUV protease ATP-binding subunit HslU
VEDIGARRLHTVLERILEDAAFGIDLGRIVVDEAYVRDRLDDLAGDEDLSRYIL